MELGYTTSITLEKRETQGQESLQYVEERFGERQAHTKNNAEPEWIYPALPTKEASTYTFELKGYIHTQQKSISYPQFYL